MPNRGGTLEVLAQELGLALAPLETQLATGAYDLFEALGLRLPPGFLATNELATALGEGAAAAAELPARVSTLAAAIGDDDLTGILTSSANLMDVIRQVIEAISGIGNAVENVGANLGSVSEADIAIIQAELPVRLLN